MNWNQIEGQWKQIGSEIKTKWAKLTDDDLKLVEAKKDQLVGKIQERYGILKDEAEQQVDRWMSTLSHKPTTSSGNEPAHRSATDENHTVR